MFVFIRTVTNVATQLDSTDWSRHDQLIMFTQTVK